MPNLTASQIELNHRANARKCCFCFRIRTSVLLLIASSLILYTIICGEYFVKNDPSTYSNPRPYYAAMVLLGVELLTDIFGGIVITLHKIEGSKVFNFIVLFKVLVNVIFHFINDFQPFYKDWQQNLFYGVLLINGINFFIIILYRRALNDIFVDPQMLASQSLPMPGVLPQSQPQGQSATVNVTIQQSFANASGSSGAILPQQYGQQQQQQQPYGYNQYQQAPQGQNPYGYQQQVQGQGYSPNNPFAGNGAASAASGASGQQNSEQLAQYHQISNNETLQSSQNVATNEDTKQDSSTKAGDAGAVTGAMTVQSGNNGQSGQHGHHDTVIVHGKDEDDDDSMENRQDTLGVDNEVVQDMMKTESNAVVTKGKYQQASKPNEVASKVNSESNKDSYRIGDIDHIHGIIPQNDNNDDNDENENKMNENLELQYAKDEYGNVITVTKYGPDMELGKKRNGNMPVNNDNEGHYAKDKLENFEILSMATNSKYLASQPGMNGQNQDASVENSIEAVFDGPGMNNDDNDDNGDNHVSRGGAVSVVAPLPKFDKKANSKNNKLNVSGSDIISRNDSDYPALPHRLDTQLSTDSLYQTGDELEGVSHEHIEVGGTNAIHAIPNNDDDYNGVVAYAINDKYVADHGMGGDPAVTGGGKGARSAQELELAIGAQSGQSGQTRRKTVDDVYDDGTDMDGIGDPYVTGGATNKKTKKGSVYQ